MHAFKYFVKVLIFFVFIFISLAITAFHISKYMRDQSAANDQYFQTFDKIKTDQFNSSFGGGGIYWLSDKSVVLRGVVEEDGGQPVYGLYKVTLDGEYTRLVDVIDRKGWSYCVSQGVVYLRSRSGNFNVIYKDILIEIIDPNRKTKTNYYSPIRCDFVDRPDVTKGYLPLLKEDGLIEKPYHKIEEYQLLLVRDNGSLVTKINKIPLLSTSRGTTRYVEYSDSYFGVYGQKRCAHVWWLKRETWKYKSDEICLGDWIDSSSRVFNSTKSGLFVENYSHKKPAAYLIKDGNEYLIDTVSSRAAAISPDGCKVAYASGDYRRRASPDDYRQTLKVFNACQFIKDQDGKG